MTLKTILKTAEKFAVDNSPGILTGLGVAGAVTTAVLTGKAGYSSALLIADEDQISLGETNEKLDSKQKLLLVWKEFVPAGIVGVVTVAAIIGANQIGSRRAAAITAAFKLSEELSEEYKKRVVKTLGLKKEEDMRAEEAGEKMAANPPSSMMIVAGSDVLFYDTLSGRYFTNQVENVKQAVNEINHQVNNDFYASLSDLYGKIGLENTMFSDELGWNSDELLRVEFTATMAKDKPAIAISYNRHPIRGFDRVS